MNTRKSLKTLARHVKIESVYGQARKPYDQLSDWQREAHNYRVTLRYRRRRMSVDFFMGQANTSEPTAEGVLDCLLSDCQAGDQTFDEFCSELGYDSDSRKAHDTWQACAETAPKLRRLLGTDFDTFLYSDRN